MARSLCTGKAYAVTQVTGFDPTDPVGSVRKLVKKGDVLLAHADDGVIWGKAAADGELVTSHEVAPEISPALRNATLWDVRIFGPEREIMGWRDGDGVWHAREIGESASIDKPAFEEWYDEPQLLWGSHGKHIKSGGLVFTRLSHEAQGLLHAFPAKLRLSDDGKLAGEARPAVLIRHYLAEGEDAARVAASRLVKIGTVVEATFKEI